MTLNLSRLTRAVALEVLTAIAAGLCVTTAFGRNVMPSALAIVVVMSVAAVGAGLVAGWRDGRLLIAWRYPRLLRAGVPLEPELLRADLFDQLEGALAAWTRLTPNMRGFLESAPDELVALAKQACDPLALQEAGAFDRALLQATEVRAHFEALQVSAFIPRVSLDTLRTRSHALAAAALEQRQADQRVRS